METSGGKETGLYTKSEKLLLKNRQCRKDTRHQKRNHTRMNHDTINKKFEAAIKAHDMKRLEELVEEYAEHVEKEKKEKLKNNPYA